MDTSLSDDIIGAHGAISIFGAACMGSPIILIIFKNKRKLE